MFIRLNLVLHILARCWLTLIDVIAVTFSGAVWLDGRKDVQPAIYLLQLLQRLQNRAQPQVTREKKANNNFIRHIGSTNTTIYMAYNIQ